MTSNYILFCFCPACILAEVSLQQALECLAVTGLVADHLMRQAASVLPPKGRLDPYSAYYSEVSAKSKEILEKFFPLSSLPKAESLFQLLFSSGFA